MKKALFSLTLILLVCSACSSSAVQEVLPTLTALPTYTPLLTYTPLAVVNVEQANTLSHEVEPGVSTTQEVTETPIPSTTPVPVRPGWERVDYFKIFPGFYDMPESMWLDFNLFYEASRYSEEHYTLRQEFQESNSQKMGYFLAAQVTVAEPGILNREMLRELPPELVMLKEQEDYPQLGDESVVFSGPRQVVRVIKDDQFFIEVVVIGGHSAFSPELAYRIAEMIYNNIPADLTPPAEFELAFPQEGNTEGAQNGLMENTVIRNYSISGEFPERVSLGLYEDMALEYVLKYPAQELFWGLKHQESGNYVYQRYKKCSYIDFRTNYSNLDNLQQGRFFLIFAPVPSAGFYEYRVWVDEEQVLEYPLEFYLRQQ